MLKSLLLTALYFRWGHTELKKTKESRNADDGQPSESDRNPDTNINRFWKTNKERNKIIKIIAQPEKYLEV